MEKGKLREIVKKSVEGAWYNRRAINPIGEQIELITEEIYQALRQPPVMQRLPTSEDVKRWHALLVGQGEEFMHKDIKETFANRGYV